MRAVVLLALGLASVESLPIAAVTERPGVTVFEPARLGDIVLAIRLNERGPFRFLLDTGSTHSAVSARTAADIGAPVVAKTMMGSAAGSREALVVRVDVMEAGPISVRGLLASIVELEDNLDGVIGHDALEPIRYTIDFRHRRIEWWPIEMPVARGSVVDVESSHGRFLLTLSQRGSTLRLVPDTGASSLLLFDPDRKLAVASTPQVATLRTISAEAAVRVARVPELRVGTLTLRDVPAVVARRDPSEPAEVDGLLPLHLFDRVTVDGPRKRMMFF
jgi:predicted aspartyl protease